jgi:hypothetical protein
VYLKLQAYTTIFILAKETKALITPVPFTHEEVKVSGLLFVFLISQ